MVEEAAAEARLTTNEAHEQGSSAWNFPAPIQPGAQQFQGLRRPRGWDFEKGYGRESQRRRVEESATPPFQLGASEPIYALMD
jgi:hypothetical protein